MTVRWKELRRAFEKVPNRVSAQNTDDRCIFVVIVMTSTQET